MDTTSCPHAATCGGCPLLDQPTAEQLERKRDRIVRAVGRYPALVAVAVRPVAAADELTRYRTRAKLVVGPGAAIGLYARQGDHVVVDVPGCRVLSRGLVEVTEWLRGLLVERRLPVAALRAVDLREAIGPDDRARVLVTLVLERASTPPSGADLEAWADAVVSRAPAVASVAVSFREPRSAQVLGRDLRVVAGPAAVPDRITEAAEGGPAPWAPAVHGGFVQVHRGQGARLRRLVADGLAAALDGLPGRHVVDAYGGSGGTGLALAARGARVTLVEAHAPSVEHARVAARAQGLAVDVVCGDAASVLGELEGVDAIVLNPPRRGVAPAVRRAAAALRPRAIAVVSCEPETLARDLDHLVRLGWGTDELSPIDMIPQTDEVETVAILRPRLVPAPTILHEDSDLLAVDKPAHAPVIAGNTGRQTAMVERVRLVPGFAEAVPLQRLDEGTSGVCLFGRSAGAANWAPALVGAEAEVVVLVRGIVRDAGVVAVRHARAQIRRARVVGGQSLISVRLPPSRVEPLRRALARIGHPVLGDDRHGHAPSNRHFLERHGLDRPFLHCAQLTLRHPRTGEALTIRADLPGELAAVLASEGA